MIKHNSKNKDKIKNNVYKIVFLSESSKIQPKGGLGLKSLKLLVFFRREKS